MGSEMCIRDRPTATMSNQPELPATQSNQLSESFATSSESFATSNEAAQEPLHQQSASPSTQVDSETNNSSPSRPVTFNETTTTSDNEVLPLSDPVTAAPLSNERITEEAHHPRCLSQTRRQTSQYDPGQGEAASKWTDRGIQALQAQLDNLQRKVTSLKQLLSLIHI